jgi:murein DD-endopeptidase MepM/ murein hydrolase activator NlpD
MRPVSDQYRITQGFASLPTRGVVGNLNGSQVQVLVALYGHYQEDGHAGTDVGCPVGTPVRAARSGTVIWCDWDVNLPGGPNDWAARWFFYQRFGGRLLLVQHAPGDIDVYAHLSAFKVRKGQFVNEGDLVALSGDSSAGQDGMLGPHLHAERIVDLGYPTGAGKIYGRIDPTTVWGGLAAQGSTNEGDIFMALSDEQQKRILDAADRINGRVHDVDVLNAKDGAYMNNTRDAQFAAIMEALGKTLNKDDGGYIVKLVQAIKPGETDAAAVADALAGIIPADIATEVANELAKRLVK